MNKRLAAILAAVWFIPSVLAQFVYVNGGTNNVLASTTNTYNVTGVFGTSRMLSMSLSAKFDGGGGTNSGTLVAWFDYSADGTHWVSNAQSATLVLSGTGAATSITSFDSYGVAAWRLATTVNTNNWLSITNTLVQCAYKPSDASFPTLGVITNALAADGNSAHYLNGAGGWTTPAGGASGNWNANGTTNSDLYGVFTAESGVVTNGFAAGTYSQGATKILTAGQHLTNIADIGSGSGLAMTLSNTNVNIIGGLSADNVKATNAVDAASYLLGGSAFVATGGGNVNLTGHLVEGIVDITTLTAGHEIITNGFQVNTNSLYVTNNAVGIGTIAPTHVLHIVTATNDAVGIDSTGTDSNSMLHIKNTTAQGPFFDFWAANDRYGYGVASGGAFDIRHTGVGNDPVNGTNILTLDASSVLTTATVDATTAVSTPTVNSGTINNTNAITTGSLSAGTNVTAGAIVGTNSVTSGAFVIKQVSLTQGVSPLADSTNQVLDFSQGMYQIWTLTNDVCFTNFTGSSSAATIKFRPNGANRNVLIDTNWMPVNVQGGTLNGTHYQFVVTNGTTFSVLSAWASGANATNVAAVWANF